jgi:2-polyprenyl-3-methyl-5-hydroxy-6-metoxy-1,4-benzoquinol methylase
MGNQLSQSLLPTVSMNFLALDQLRLQLTDHGYVEYLYHKFFNAPDIKFTGVDNHMTWQYPECWLSRYWLNYSLHGHLLNNANVLEFGSNFCFYSEWTALNGARSVTGIEPDVTRQSLSIEYVDIRGLNNKVSTSCRSIDQFMAEYTGEKYDVVFFQDVLYYLANGIDVLEFIKKKIKPKYLFLESTVVEDVGNDGHFKLWYPSVQSRDFQSFDHNRQTAPAALMPSRQALRSIINHHDWKILCYYDYQDFIGHGESVPRKQGRKDFYILQNLDN